MFLDLLSSVGAVVLLVFLLLLLFFCFRYIRSIVKRIFFVNRLKRANVDQIAFSRSFLHSVFLPDGKTDIVLTQNGNTFAICLFTTPFRRVRLHFSGSNECTVIYEHAAALLSNPKSYARVNVVKNSYELVIYKIHIDRATEEQTAVYVIPLPAPKAVSSVEDNRLHTLYDGDTLTNGTVICGARYFIKKILQAEEDHADQ